MKCSFAGMNYLGHAYLSFNHPQIVVGNLISDFVKGSARFGFSGNILKGITLHRQIDTFTDSHPATKKAREVFRPHYRLYSGAIMDIVYDHFLANDGSIFNEHSLREFVHRTYSQLEEHSATLPPNFLHVFTYMRSQDWLFSYRFHQGIKKTLAGLARRATYLQEGETAFQLFMEHYHFLGQCYQEFFSDVKQFAKENLEKLLL